VNICVIPARGGSKRIKRKNIKLFFGKPIIAYSIMAALKSNCFDQVIVSTDDDEIKKISEEWGAIVPFFRPKKISNDYTSINDVVIHTLKWAINSGYDVKNVCCVYATAPLIQPSFILSAYQKLLDSGKYFCLSVCRFSHSVQRSFTLADDNTIKPAFPEYLLKRSQDLEEFYHDSGQFYWGTVDAFLEKKSVISSNSTCIVLPPNMVQDIDTIQDWESAELMFEVLTRRGENE